MRVTNCDRLSAMLDMHKLRPLISDQAGADDNAPLRGAASHAVFTDWHGQEPPSGQKLHDPYHDGEHECRIPGPAWPPLVPTAGETVDLSRDRFLVAFRLLDTHPLPKPPMPQWSTAVEHSTVSWQTFPFPVSYMLPRDARYTTELEGGE